MGKALPLKHTFIQKLTWQAALQGKDLVAVAPPRSGKTLAYLLPGIHQVLQNGIGMLILVPTVELVTQVVSVCKKYAGSLKSIGLSSSKKVSEAECEILVSTPGSLIHYIKHRKVCLKGCMYIVVDEADKLLLSTQFSELMKLLKCKKQIFVSGTTWSPLLNKVSKQFLKNPAFFQVAPKLPSPFVFVAENKANQLGCLLLRYSSERVIVVCNTVKKCTELSEAFKCLKVFTSKTPDREANLKEFKTGKALKLVTTSLVRGLDLETDLLIFYELPHCFSDYLSICGRVSYKGKVFLVLSNYKRYQSFCNSLGKV